jgi:site-specific DNA-cytosine methylase
MEFYRPKFRFFLLENIVGLLSHKLQVNKAGPQEGNAVAHGIVKFILRVLTSLPLLAIVFWKSRCRQIVLKLNNVGQ